MATPEAAQQEVVAFLEKEAFGAPVEARIDTHAAHIFLVGARAYKMKRAVRYDFLDFSTLERRHAALSRELELNRMIAPELYLELVPVVRRVDGRLGLGGEGEVVEWLLAMRRFPQEMRLDRLAARGSIAPALWDELARTIARFHLNAPVRTDCGGSISLRRVILGNRHNLEALVPEVFAADEVEALVSATEREFTRVRDLLDVRRGAGRVRHVHGDLHLENMVLLDGRPVLFDRIEFDEELACIDLLYDLAFLLMDLLARGLRVEAQRVLQGWNEEMVDDSGQALLPLFLSLRAAIRAKVTGLRARLEEERGRRQEAVVRARQYLALARELLRPALPRLIVIGGRSGTGKTSLAYALAPLLDPPPGADILRSDVVRKRLFGKAPTERLPPEAYRPEVSAEVFETLALRARALLDAGRSVICDAVYGKAAQRERIAQVARERRVEFRGFWLEAPEEVCVARAAARRADASDAGPDVVRHQTATLETAGLTWERIDAARPLAEVVADVRRRLGL